MSDQRDPYGGQQYTAVPYGQQLTGYGPVPGSRPAKPGSIVTAAVLGFVWGALGVLVTFGFVIAAVGGRAFVAAVAGNTDEAALGARLVTGVAAVLALLALAWTVVMIWGGVLALTGRSRVLLIVGGSIAIAGTGLYCFVALANADQAGVGGVTVTLLLLAVSVLIVVLLVTRAAARFFATHRALRAR
jgi:hypothetical protein